MAPLVALPLILVCGMTYAAVAVGLSSVLPRVRCSKWTRRLVSFTLLVAGIPAFIWCAKQGSQALLVIMAFGFDEYASGLRIINKHGELSDGRSLGDVWMGVWGAFLFLSLALPILPLVVFRLWVARTKPRSDRSRRPAEP
jgi:xanthine/uracil permease